MRSPLAVSLIFSLMATAAAAQPWTDPRFEIDVRFPPPDPNQTWLSPGTVWKYTLSTPPADWYSESFDDSGWLNGQTGFGSGGIAEPLDNVVTPWFFGGLWLRTSFELDDLSSAPVLWGRWDDTIEVYVNGVPAFSQEYWSPVYRYARLSDEVLAALRVGTNTIAAAVVDYGGGRYADLTVARNPMADMPVTGFEINPALAPLHDLAYDYFQQNIVPSAAVAVMKGNRVVLNCGYGYLEKTQQTPTPYTTVFRLASLDKAPGAAAARRLVTDGFVDPVTGTQLQLDTPVFPLLAARGLQPLPGMTLDPRANDITIGHLIRHESGLPELPWVADLLAVTGTPLADFSSADSVRWMYGQPLAFDPNSTEQYCSACMMLLRHVVDVLTGDFEAYFHDVVMDGYSSEGLVIAHEPLALRLPGEPWYETHEMPYDRDVYLDHFFALAGSAEAYARFGRGYNIHRGHRLLDFETGAWAPRPDNGASWFGGGMAGTRTYAIQRRWDEVTIVVLTNANADVGPLAVVLNYLIDTLPASAFEHVGDIDANGVTNAHDGLTAARCLGGPDQTTPPAGCDDAAFDLSDLDGDEDADMLDIQSFQHQFLN